MPATTAWERHIRRREVIRLKVQGYNVQEIAEETGVSEDTVYRDLDRIESELEKMMDGDELSKQLLRTANHLLDHEMQDLRDADREQDEGAKHKAKSSLRSTLKLIEQLAPEGQSGEQQSDTEEFLNSLDEDTKEQVAEQAGKQVEELLE